MSINLLNHVSDKFSDATYTKLSSLMGLNMDSTRSAVGAALPTIMKAIVSRGDTTENASALRNFIRTNNIASNVATDFLNLDEASTHEYLEIGNKASDFLFGAARESLVGNIVKSSGLSAEKGSKLTQLLAPLALGHTSKLANRENYTDIQLSSYLKSQKDKLMSTSNSGSTETRKTEESSVQTIASSGGMFKWLIPLLGLLGLLWWFSQKACATAETSTDTTEEKTAVNKTAETKTQKTGTVDNTKTTSTPTNDGWALDANGNLIDGNGMLIKKSGQFTITDGYYLDLNGTKLSAAAAIGSASSGVSSTSNTTDGFKTVFTNMFTSKEKVGTTYALSRIVFDTKSHKITDFSKAEVEGLANALKTIPGAKIQVQVHSNDGDDNTKLRAQVVKDMLVTLGVDKGQISSKGMGDTDATKAANNKVEIKVEAVK